MPAIDRRTLLRLGTATALATGLRRVDAGLLARGGVPTGPARLSAGVHLFIDDHWIAAAEHVHRRVETPARLPQPIVSAAVDRACQPYVSVLWSQERQRFCLWYNTRLTEQTSRIGYLESPDGIRWARPHRELPIAARVHFGASVIDRGPDVADPAARYRIAWDRNGVMMADSPDGLAWTPVSAEPAIPDTGDIVSLSYDPIRRRYVVLCKMETNASTARTVGQSVSEDGVAWSRPQRVIASDAWDEGQTEFYGVGNLLARGDLLIGLLRVLRDDLPAEPGGPVDGIGYTVLAWSRDGESWHRDRQPFLPRNPVPGTWDRAMTWGDRLLPVGGDVFVYYGGYARGHKRGRFTERNLGLAWMARDRYVAREAGAEWGWLRTPPALFEGTALNVNADIRGELRARILGPHGAPLRGFDFSDSRPLTGNSLAHRVTWTRYADLSVLAGQPVTLEFLLRDARVYGLEVVAAPCETDALVPRLGLKRRGAACDT